MKIENISVDELKPYQNNARTHSDKQVSQIARSIKDFGFNNPVLVDSKNNIIAGHGRVLAAKQLGLLNVPVIRHEHLTELQLKAYILADNKLAEKAGWDRDILRIEFENILNLDIDFDLTATGFDTPDIDLVLIDDLKETDISEDILRDVTDIPQRVKSGDLWQLGQHRLYCGDSLKPESFQRLLSDEKANLIFCDPPYNVPINGHVLGKENSRHSEFAFASGEMSESEFIAFLNTAFENMAFHSKDGSIHYICMDWRHIREMNEAAQDVYSELKNICVWNKQSGGMGSLYRSQHEFIFVFKNGTAPHINNIELGKHGRYRTNVWDYHGVNATGPHAKNLKFHPTVKPVSMIADAIIDCSKQGDIVLDCFGGSGSTLLAAERTKRKARLIEYEPKYCDVILHRFVEMTGINPLLLEEKNVG